MIRDNKRDSLRIRKRIVVFIQDGNIERRAMTVNLSQSGLQLQTDGYLAAGTRVAGQIMTPSGRVPFCAEVRWFKKPRSGRALDEKNCAGLRFVVDPGPRYRDLLAESLTTAAGNFALSMR